MREDERTQSSCIRVLVVDSHPVLRKGLRSVLTKDEGFEVVGEAGTRDAALARALELQPDLVILDLFLGSENGLDLVKQLQQGCPQTRLMIFTGWGSDDLRVDALRIGVQGYLSKTCSASDVLSALRAVHQGERVVGERQAVPQVFNELQKLPQEPQLARYRLSPQEIEIIRLASLGYSNREIGARLFWSEVTVKRKMQRIYQKFQVSDRTHLVAEAIRLGLI